MPTDLTNLFNEPIVKSSTSDNRQHAVKRSFSLDTELSENDIDPILKANGSNNFIISGKLTESGRPIIGNDPHLENKMPSFWHLAKISIAKENLNIEGAFMPGIPSILIGTNGSVSVAITAGLTDVSDIYKVKKQGKGMLLDGFEVPYKERVERVYTNSSKTTYEDILFKDTQFGPVITDYVDAVLALGGVETKLNFKEEEYDLIFSSPSISGDSLTGNSCIEMSYVRTLDELKKTLRQISSNLNILYADVTP